MKEKTMKITKITPVGKLPVYDISVANTKHYVLANGVITHNTGAYYSADNIWIVGRRQDKSGKEIQGYHFVIRVEKSRFVRENSKIPISVSWERGISKWSGLLDIAMEAGWVKKPKQGWYARWDRANNCAIGKNLREAETDTAEFWKPILEDKEFQAWITHRYKISTQDMIEDVDLETLLAAEED